MNERGVCDVSGSQDVAYRVQICMGEHVFCVRSDIAEILKYFLIMCWYPEYLTALYQQKHCVDKKLQYDLFLLMEQKLVNVMIVAQSKQRIY